MHESTSPVPQSAEQGGAYGRLRRLARAMRHAPDRLLHRWRRRRALGRLRQTGAPASVLVVCHGNICRSPYAAASMYAALPSALRHSVHITSAGFIGAGRPAPPEAIAVAAGLGVDLTDHRSKPLSPTVVRGAQLIVVMDTDQQRDLMQRFGRQSRDVLVLGDLDPNPIDTRAIRDPVEQPVAVFEETYARIDRCVFQFVNVVSERSSRSPRRARSAE